jgi:hypothetical protein
MKKATVTFEFLKKKGEGPICIAKTKTGTFICLEYYPTREDYMDLCHQFLYAFMFQTTYPLKWQEIESKTRKGRISQINQGRRSVGLPRLHRLPL